MSLDNPKISVLCPSYNHEKYVKYFIEGILNQTEQDFELIIVDDNSTDNNVEEIKKFDDPRIKFIQHEYNKGVTAGLNSCFEKAKGKYIVLAASDDISEPHHLKYASEYLDNNPDINVFYSSLKLVDENNKNVEDKNNIFIRTNENKYNLLRTCFFLCNPLLSPGTMIRKSAFEKNMPLDLSLIQYQDYQIHIKLLLENEIFISSEPLVNYRMASQPENISANCFGTQIRESLEEDKLMDTFLEIKDVQTLKNIFNEDILEMGEPTKETIPYFLGMLAINSNRRTRKNWGYQTIMKFIEKKENFDLLNKLYGFDFKIFINLVKDFNVENQSNFELQQKIIETKHRKYTRYKKLATILGLFLGGIILLNIIFGIYFLF